MCVRILRVTVEKGKEGEVGKNTVTIELPAGLYAKLEELAAESDSSPTDQIATLVEDAKTRRAWIRALDDMSKQIQEDDNRETEPDQEEFIEQLRKARREIFEAEYAHLYR